MSTSTKLKYQYLIIGGTTKAATTSLYYYLADHPEVSVSTLKETRFFIDEDYPVVPVSAKWNAGSQDFSTFFKDSDTKCRVEATPDYLYSAGTPERIKSMLPGAKLVFLLRNPITRLVSWYKYARQRADIPTAMSFTEYVETQLERGYFEEAKENRLKMDQGQDAASMLGQRNIPSAYFLSALEHGKYATYLQPYYETFGAENIKVYFYENLCANPADILTDLCEFAGISPEVYADYDFKVFNRSTSMKSAVLNKIYADLRTAIRRRTHNHPIHKVLSQLRLWFDPIYLRLNAQKMEEVVVPPGIKAQLENYYQEDVEQLEKMLGRPSPWNNEIATAKKVR